MAKQDIKQCSYELLYIFSNNETPNELMFNCVNSKLSELCVRDSNAIDDSLNQLMNSIDYDNICQTKSILTKMNKYVMSTRSHLISILERMVG